MVRGAYILAKNKIKQGMAYIQAFLLCFTVFVAYPWYKFALLNSFLLKILDAYL